MDKTAFDNIVTKFREKGFEFKFDYYFFAGKSILRGIFVYNADESAIKNSLDSSVMKGLKIKKTYTWYLGDRKEIFFLKLKDEFEVSISDLEKFQVNNSV